MRHTLHVQYMVTTYKARYLVVELHVHYTASVLHVPLICFPLTKNLYMVIPSACCHHQSSWRFPKGIIENYEEDMDAENASSQQFLKGNCIDFSSRAQMKDNLISVPMVYMYLSPFTSMLLERLCMTKIRKDLSVSEPSGSDENS